MRRGAPAGRGAAGPARVDRVAEVQLEPSGARAVAAEVRDQVCKSLAGLLEHAAVDPEVAGSTLVAEPGGLVSPVLMAMQNQVLGDPSTPFRIHYIADGKSMRAIADHV